MGELSKWTETMSSALIEAGIEHTIINQINISADGETIRAEELGYEQDHFDTCRLLLGIMCKTGVTND